MKLYLSGPMGDWRRVILDFKPWHSLDAAMQQPIDATYHNLPNLIYSGRSASAPPLRCLAEVALTDAMFAWLPDAQVHGAVLTVAEIGVAAASNVPIFICFGDHATAERFQHITPLAKRVVVDSNVEQAFFDCLDWLEMTLATSGVNR